jgi:hypothetical protein
VLLVLLAFKARSFGSSIKQSSPAR